MEANIQNTDTYQNPIEAQREAALRHYHEASSLACHWSSFVEAAIKAYNPQQASVHPASEDRGEKKSELLARIFPAYFSDNNFTSQQEALINCISLLEEISDRYSRECNNKVTKAQVIAIDKTASEARQSIILSTLQPDAASEALQGDIADEFRSIISHALLGSDTENVSKETWDLVINECAKYAQKLRPAPTQQGKEVTLNDNNKK